MVKNIINIKNIRLIASNEIILDYEHPEYGWIPYSAFEDADDEFMKEIWKKASKNKDKLPLDIETVKSRLFDKVNYSIHEIVREIENKYTKSEMNLWEMKYQEAQKVIKGETSILLEAEAEIEEKPIKDLAESIIEKYVYYKSAINIAEIKKKKLIKELDCVKTEDDINRFIKLNKIKF